MMGPESKGVTLTLPLGQPHATEVYFLLVGGKGSYLKTISLSTPGLVCHKLISSIMIQLLLRIPDHTEGDHMATAQHNTHIRTVQYEVKRK